MSLQGPRRNRIHDMVGEQAARAGAPNAHDCAGDLPARHDAAAGGPAGRRAGGVPALSCITLDDNVYKGCYLAVIRSFQDRETESVFKGRLSKNCRVTSSV